MRVMPFFRGCSTEYQLECTKAHEEFQELVEKKLEGFLGTNGWTTEEFYQRMRDELTGIDSLEKEHEHAEELVRMINDAFDFDSWAQSMRWSANGLMKFEEDNVASLQK
jgi:hypothetical protein